MSRLHGQIDAIDRATAELRERDVAARPGAVDRSVHPTVVEYAVQEMFKGKPLRTAAKATARKLSGHVNLFMGPEPTFIDPALLEEALWNRMVERVIDGATSFKTGKEHVALDATLDFYKQAAALRPALKARAVAALGRNPFVGDAS